MPEPLKFEVGERAAIHHLPVYIYSDAIIIPCTIVKVGDDDFVRVDTEYQKNIKIRKSYLIPYGVPPNQP